MTLSISTPVLSTGSLTAHQFFQAVTTLSPRTPYNDFHVQKIADRVIHWCGVFGVNHDIVFAQTAHETNWFRYGGDVIPEQWNFAGLGATGGVPGYSFPLPNGLIKDDGIEAGVLAVVAHHMVYAVGSKEKWPVHLQQYAGNHVDPRYSAVLSTGNAGKMIVLGDYRGTWAVPGTHYPEALVSRSKHIAAFPKGEPMTAQIPGFRWEGAAATHYAKGRTVPVRGGAQHYTAGTNSLSWLTKTSKPAVSATFLVKHNPTMNDRGWQLVRLEDTAWTTAFANAYTVSIEYEHHPGVHGSVPDIAFTVLAQSWIDIAAEVKKRGLGFIPLDRSGIRGHREWVNNPSLTCPDGVFVDRIVDEIKRLQGGQDVDFSKVKTERDPWRDHLGGNPYGKSFWIPRVFVEEINRNGGFMPVGFVTGGAFVDGGQLVQYFERARLELNENGVTTRGLVGLEALAVRSPDRLP